MHDVERLDGEAGGLPQVLQQHLVAQGGAQGVVDVDLLATDHHCSSRGRRGKGSSLAKGRRVKGGGSSAGRDAWRAARRSPACTVDATHAAPGAQQPPALTPRGSKVVDTEGGLEGRCRRGWSGRLRHRRRRRRCGGGVGGGRSGRGVGSGGGRCGGGGGSRGCGDGRRRRGIVRGGSARGRRGSAGSAFLLLPAAAAQVACAGAGARGRACMDVSGGANFVAGTSPHPR